MAKQIIENLKTHKCFWQFTAAGLLLFSILLQLWPPTGLAKTFRSVGQDPWSIKKRLALARELFDAGQIELAEQELAYLNSNRLFQLIIKRRPDLQQDFQTTKDKLEAPKKIQAEIDYWEKVLEEKPGYRDALLRLAILYYQLYQDEKALAAWQETNRLDPNNEEVQRVGQIISQNLSD